MKKSLIEKERISKMLNTAQGPITPLTERRRAISTDQDSSYSVNDRKGAKSEMQPQLSDLGTAKFVDTLTSGDALPWDLSREGWLKLMVGDELALNGLLPLRLCEKKSLRVMRRSFQAVKDQERNT